MTACNSYYQDEDEGRAERQRGSTAEPTIHNYTGPRTLDGRPAPQDATTNPAQKPIAQPKKKGIATLGSLGSSHHQHDDHDDDSDEDFDDDDDDDGRGNLFAGGEKSGLAVQDPKQEGGSKKLINDILAKAKKYVYNMIPNSLIEMKNSNLKQKLHSPGSLVRCWTFAKLLLPWNRCDAWR